MHRYLAPLTVILSALLLMTPPAVAAADCQFILGFATLKALLDAAEGPDKVGQCLEDQHFNPANGDALQQTTGGLLVWRKVDNWTAFTDGYRTWINGPNGLQARLNTEQFEWEPDPWPPTGAVPLGTTQRVIEKQGWPDPDYIWEIMILNVERGPAIDYRTGDKSSGYRPYQVLLPNQEQITVEVQVKAVGSGQLGEDYGLFIYFGCAGSVQFGRYTRCYDRVSLSPFELVMQNGEQGDRRNYPTFGMPAGQAQTERLAWNIWKGQDVVLAITWSGDEQSVSDYPVVFALR